MRTIYLKGQVGEKRGWPRFKLDLESYSVETEWQRDAKEAQARAAGVGAYVKCGNLFSRRASFVALYTLESSLYLLIDSKRWDLLNGNVTIERRNTFMGKRFRVMADQVIEWECTYLTLDYEKFPDEDILWYVARSTVSRDARVRTMLMWQDIAEGKWEWSESYNANLNQRVRTYPAVASSRVPS